MESCGAERGRGVLVLGSYVADVSFRVGRMPAWGETLMGSGFALGPGGKGSNQAVAAARAGAPVGMLTKVGNDAFGQIAREVWARAGVDASMVRAADTATGAAAILVDEARGENAIVVVPGACFTLSAEEVDGFADAVRAAKVLVAQLELPLATVQRGLEIAREAGVTTVLNPAPAPDEPLGGTLLHLAEFLVPNKGEAARLSGVEVTTVADAARAARRLQERGARHVIVTLGERGALLCPPEGEPVPVAAFTAGACVDTTGAGDAFCGAFAAALWEGRAVLDAVQFACVAAGISVTRPGTAASMPVRAEVESALAAFVG